MTDIAKTPEDAIGHVAPDFNDRRHINTLRMRPQYRISMRLGSVDALCPDPPASTRGRQTRLQLLGYLYEPLTSGAMPAKFETVWRWFENELHKGDPDIADELNHIVEGGSLPAPGASARVMLPGSYCFSDADVADAMGRTNTWPLPPAHSYHFAREQAVWDANPVMGAIPIIATVEQYTEATGQWAPAPGVTVYLQLQPPAEPTGSALAPPARGAATHAPPAPTDSPGPAGYVRRFTNNPNQRTPLEPGDPQVDNCHSVAGGKRGLAVAGHVLELNLPDGSPRAGFYRAHDGRAAVPGTHWMLPPEAAPVAIPHAIRAITNAAGEAGFVFKPSRTAGDRYKLRAFLGAPTVQSDGTGPDAVAVETGTLVAWRRIRFARYLVWDYPAGYVEPPAPPDEGDRSAVDGRHFRVRRMGPIDLGVVANEFRKAYCDVVIEATAARRVVSAAEWSQARAYALSRMPRIAHVDLRKLIPELNETPCIVPVLPLAAYNAAVAGAVEFPQLQDNEGYWLAMRDAVLHFLVWFADYFTRDALPFVVIQAPFGDSLTLAGTVPVTRDNGYLTTSGRASPRRAAHLWWGKPFYDVFSYSIDHNTAHETGHCHYGAHSWMDARGGAGLAGGFPTQHDEHDRCVMGYLAMPGDFCGKCLLRLRGWDIAALWVDSQYLVQIS